jgi:hypothetical protein
MEQISSSRLPKLIDLMARIAEGRSQATAQVGCTDHRKPILRMLDETRALGVSNEQPPSVSSESHEVLAPNPASRVWKKAVVCR